MRHSRVLLILVAPILLCAVSFPTMAQHTVFFTPDVATDDPEGTGQVFMPWDVIAYHSPDYHSVPVLSFRAGTIVDALHKLDAPGEWLLSVADPTALPDAGSFVFQPEDVIHYDGLSYTLYFDGSANGVSPGASVDAVLMVGGDTGDLVVSFNTATTIGVDTFEAADLVRFSAGAFSLYFDASTTGSGIAGSSTLIGGADCGQTVLAFDVATDLSPSAGPSTYVRGDLAGWDGASFSLFAALPGWPARSQVNALSCCADEDGDLLCTPSDNCPLDANPGQEDGDSDGLGDACDGCPQDPQNDSDTDGICGDVDNCPEEANSDQSDVDLDGQGDLCDPCPAVAEDDCETGGSTAEVVPAAEGGTVDSPDGSLSLDIPPNSLAADTTISATARVPGDEEVDLSFGANPGVGQAVSVFNFQPDGQTFDPPATLNIIADVSEVNPSHLDRLALYLWTDTGGDGVDGKFVEIDGAACTVTNDPAGCDPRDPPSVCASKATCTAELTHFSVYALVAPLDDDDDGIPNLFDGIEDVCPDSPNVISGFLPPMTDLVPATEEVPLPDKAFKANRTIPMKLDYLCGTDPLTDESQVNPPELFELWRVGEAEPLPIIDPDSGEANDSGVWFRYSGEHWVYNLSTKGFASGTYEVYVKMPDGRLFKGGFVLR